jgi:hypothetical protein
MSIYFHIANWQNQLKSIFFIINLNEEYVILYIFPQNKVQIMEARKMNNSVHVMILISESFNQDMTNLFIHISLNIFIKNT